MELKVNYVGLEGNLQKDTKDKKGALAKAITSMPDNITIIAQELAVLNLRSQKNIKLVLVKKEGTSKYHHNCVDILE